MAGRGALARLSALIQSPASPRARAAALSALDGADDARAASIALAALPSPDADVAIAALAVLRGWVEREEGTRILEAITSTALDRARDARVRLAALDALSDLPRDLVQPILEQAPPADLASCGDDPSRVRDWIGANGRTAPLSALHQAITRSRDFERAALSSAAQLQWLTTRGAAHAALAVRGSRVALYDLREAFDAARAPLPLDFLTAIAAIGDDSCLEPLARAWAAAERPSWWRARLSDAAADIVGRMRLTGRNSALKRVRSKWEGFV